MRPLHIWSHKYRPKNLSPQGYLAPTFLIVFLMMLGCASVKQDLNPDTLYMRDMEIEANGFKGIGTLVIPSKEKIVFNLTAKGKISLLDFQTCHRVISTEDPGNKGVFGDKKKATIEYIPVKGIEDGGECDILIGGYNIKGRHSWSYIAIEYPKYQLPALISCNGSQYNSRGVTVCQSKIGLIQKIEFTEEAKFIPQVSCPIETKDGKSFEYKTAKGECVYVFKSGDKFHRLVTIGWESILIRED